MIGDAASQPAPRPRFFESASRRRHAPALAAVLALVLAAACDDVVVRPADVASVRIEPTEAQVPVGSTVQLTARVLDAEGRPVSGIPIAWTSTDSTAASVSGAGLVTGRRGGQVQIRAEAGGQTGSAAVQVLRLPQTVLDRTVIGFSASSGGSAPRPVVVSITNGGDLPLTELTAAIDFGDGPTGWLTVELAGTTAPTTLEVAASQAGLQPGTYGAVVWVDHPAASGPESIALTLEVRVGAPDAPTDPQATVLTPTLVRVTWTSNSGDVAEFRIERREGSGSFAQIAVVGGDITTHDDDTVSPDRSYGYRIRACAAAGCSAFSVIASVTMPPVAPSGLVAATLSTTSIQLSWSDESQTETGFEVERRTGSGSFVRIANLSASATTYTDDGLSPETEYTYRVRACNSGGCSPFSGEATASTAAIPAPAAPTGLQATAVSVPRVDLSWTDQSGNETGFEVERKAGAEAYARIAELGANVTTYADAGVGPDTVYTYRVRACGEGGCSAFSNEASATTLPVPPSGVAASPVSSTAIDVTWTDESETETSFRIERRAGAGSYALAGTAPAEATAFSDTGLDPGTSYTYRVQACNDGGCSPFAGEAQATTPALPVPDAPSGLSATATQNEAEITLAWTDNSDNETSFRIERRGPGESQFTLLANIAADVVTYLDEALDPDGTYIYRVAACAAGGCSAFSNQRGATTYPLAPSGLQAAAQSSSRIDLTWVDNSATETQFRIERRTGGGSFAQVATEAANATSHSDGGLAAETSYTYRVRACNGGGCSAYTAEATATTSATPAPTAPSNLSATAISAGQIDLAWTPGSGDATELRLERRVNDGPFTLRHTMAAGTTEFSDVQVSADNAYTYRIEACASGDLCSDFSNEATAVTPPVPPSGLAATALSTSSIEVTWSDDVRTEESFEVQRMPAGASFTTVATLPEGSTAFLDQGLSAETVYTYRIRSCNAAGCSAYTAGVSATTHLPAPSGLSAVAVNATRIDLSWTDNSATEEEFRVERRTGTTGPFSQVATVAANTTSYADGGRTPGTPYQYQVRACTGAGCSDASNPASATTPDAPAAPSALSATATSTTSITLEWSDNSATEEEFRIERSTAGGAWTQIAVVGPGVESHVDEGRNPETSYGYRVRACSGDACSAYSNEATVVTWMPAPTSLSAMAVSSTEVDLTWTDQSTTETGFEVQLDQAPYATVPAGTEIYTATGLDPETPYAFRVRAVTDLGPSEWSNTASATTRPAPPTGLSATATSSSTVQLEWSNHSAVATQVRIEQREVAGGGFSEIAVEPASSTNYEDTGLTAETQYEYRVRACDGGLCSDYSAAADVTTQAVPAPLPPTGLSATAVSPTRIDLAWTDNATTETGYSVRRSDDGGPFDEVQSLGPDSESASDTGVTEATAYEYRVAACNDGGCSESGTAPATTPPFAPTGFTATATSDTTVSLSWTDASGAGPEFRIQRRTEMEDYAEIAIVPAGVTSFDDEGLTADTLYDYQIQACVDACSAWVTTSVTTDPAP
jgi:fibronectin type 3 domain-containing protein